MLAIIRKEDAEEIAAAQGCSVKDSKSMLHRMYSSLAASDYAICALNGDKLMACIGLRGNGMWWCSSVYCNQFPIAYYKLSAMALNDLLKKKEKIYTCTRSTYKQALKANKIAGFEQLMEKNGWVLSVISKCNLRSKCYG